MTHCKCADLCELLTKVNLNIIFVHLAPRLAAKCGAHSEAPNQSVLLLSGILGCAKQNCLKVGKIMKHSHYLVRIKRDFELTEFELSRNLLQDR